MRKARISPSCGAVIAGLSLATAAHAANLNIDDGTPLQLTIAHSQMDAGGGSTNGAPFTSIGSSTVDGESATFTGHWVAAADGSPGLSGVIYIVDPGQTNLVRAIVQATWTLNPGFSMETITVVVTSTKFGDNLGLLPGPFIGLGVPMPNGVMEISASFRDPGSGAPVFIPSNLTMQYVGDLVPECPEPVLMSQPPDQWTANRSDSDPAGSGPAEQADDVTFTQDVLVRSMRWWGLYASANTAEALDAFTMHVYEDVGGLPGAMPLSTVYLPTATRTGTGAIAASSFNEFIYAVSLPTPLALKANTRYWITIINDTSADPDDDWYWSTSAIGNSAQAQRLPPFTGVWSGNIVDRALEICGSAMTLDCPTDFNGDNLTDGADLAVLLANWGPCDPMPMLLAPMDPAHRIDMLTNPADSTTEVQR